MTTERLSAVLGAAGVDADARELSEMLWLACHLGGPPARPPRDGEPAGPEAGRPAEGGEAGEGEPEPPRPPRPPSGAALHAAPAPDAATRRPSSAGGRDGADDGEASRVLVPTAPMLGDPLGLQRALRPLKRHLPSRRRLVLDEDATAARIADTGVWTPVLVPEPERWLSLTLAVDTGPTMRLWRPLARELVENLLRQGAFRDVRAVYLRPDGGVAPAPGARVRARDPRTLLDPSGRHAVLVLSDCSGPHWWNGAAAGTVRRWAEAGPVAVLQPLPERLWRRSALPPAPGLAALPRPGAPNTELLFDPFDGARAPGVPVPVLEVAPRWLAGWAGLVAGGAPRPAAVAALPPHRPSRTDGADGADRADPAAPVRRERALPIEERVRRFLRSASPEAAELAAHIAVSVPSLPVMRLVQRRILGASGPGQLAEVLLSGLLRPVRPRDGAHTDAAGDADADGRYEFVEGARSALLATLPRPEAQHTRHVLEAVSAEIERRAGTSAETFPALLRPLDRDPASPAGGPEFALLSPEARAILDRTSAPPPGPGPGPGPVTVPAPDPQPPAPAAPPDLLTLNGGAEPDAFLDQWARPRDEPRPAAIALAADGGDAVALDVLAGADRHGLVVGGTAERQEVVRRLVLALAARHAPHHLRVLAAGVGEHPLGEGFPPLPHVAFSEEEMLGFPERLERFAAAVTDELDRRAGDAADRPALLVVVDVSLTLPAGRREVADLLVRLAQRGRGDRVHVVVAAGSVESSAAWSRLLALLTWRVLAGALPPRETRTVLGRTLAPSDVGEGVVHLRAGSGPVARARLAPWPPPAAAEAVAREMRRVTGQAPGEAGGLPRLVTTDALPAASGNRIPIGIDEERLAPVRLDLALDPHVLVVGPPGIGRTNVLRLVLASLAGTAAAGRALVFVIDPGGALAALADGDDRIVYGGSPNASRRSSPRSGGSSANAWPRRTRRAGRACTSSWTTTTCWATIR
ncbi:hypothetical protein GEV43_07310 [Actinomadura sp. J1-007]|uniref:SAV_2336 N-terminal domain-related protein n=1 Tax=Actinomadura sp. J1-007 TaxID=2661913 RepID=UPI001320E942|nr:SAV_2336 N-terminal domain-related protein [Actinomadura sp. J1-007]MWK33866.1 hypothetical protein [Actinomadura sp. J1-007]